MSNLLVDKNLLNIHFKQTKSTLVLGCGWYAQNMHTSLFKGGEHSD